MDQVIIEDLDAIKEEFAMVRMTDIEDGKEAVYEEAPMKVQPVVFLMDRFGYCKLLDQAAYDRNQETVESEYPHVVPCLNTDKICLFTDQGNLHQVKVLDIPFGKLRDKGTPIDNLSKFDGTRETILFLTNLEAMGGKKLLFFTRMGLIKQVPAEEFVTNNRTVVSTKLQEGDLLAAVRLSGAPEGDVVVQTEGGFFLRFAQGEIPEMKKNSRGVRAIRLEKQDQAEKLYLVAEDQTVLYKKKEIQLNRLKVAKRDGRKNMKRSKAAVYIAVLMGIASVTGCQKNGQEREAVTEAAALSESLTGETRRETVRETDGAVAEVSADQAAADQVAALIDAIYVQRRTGDTDRQCEEAKAAWDRLTDAQKALVAGENADPDYFGLDTGDASRDDPRNQDAIGEREILVVSFGTSFNDSRAEDIKGIEDAVQEAYPDWSVRRAFTSQIIINHVQARDGEKIDNMEQAMERAVANGVKELVVLPTHLMAGAEYGELMETVEAYEERFESVKVAAPLLGEVGSDASVINKDKQAVARILAAEAAKDAGYETIQAAKEDKTAFVLMGHGTSHTAMVSYGQMQTQMKKLGYDNIFVGTVEGDEAFAADEVRKQVSEAGYTRVILRPLMVVAGDHANHDMAGEDEESWLSIFEASGAFETVKVQIRGLGSVEAIQQLYVDHTADAMKQ